MAVVGRFEHERARKEPGSFFLGRFLIEFGYWCFSPLERGALALGVTPNQLTAASLACSVGGAAGASVGGAASAPFTYTIAPDVIAPSVTAPAVIVTAQSTCS